MMGITLLQIQTPDLSIENIASRAWSDERLKRDNERRTASGVRPAVVDPGRPEPFTEITTRVLVTDFWVETRTMDKADVGRELAVILAKHIEQGTKITQTIRKQARADAEDLVLARSGGTRLKSVRVFIDLNAGLVLLCTVSQPAVTAIAVALQTRLGIETGLIRPWLNGKGQFAESFADNGSFGPLEHVEGARFLQWLLDNDRAALEPVKGAAMAIRGGSRVSVSGEDVARELGPHIAPNPETGEIEHQLVKAKLLVDPCDEPVTFHGPSWSISFKPPTGEGHWTERQLDQYNAALNLWMWFQDLWSEYASESRATDTLDRTVNGATMVNKINAALEVIEKGDFHAALEAIDQIRRSATRLRHGTQGGDK